MALELEGRIARKLNIQSGATARGPWQKQEFILEYQEGNFPTQVCMNVWGEDKVKELARYSDIRAWRIEPAGQASQVAPPPPSAPMPSPDDMSSPLDDTDLPF